MLFLCVRRFFVFRLFQFEERGELPLAKSRPVAEKAAEDRGERCQKITVQSVYRESLGDVGDNARILCLPKKRNRIGDGGQLCRPAPAEETFHVAQNGTAGGKNASEQDSGESTDDAHPESAFGIVLFPSGVGTYPAFGTFLPQNGVVQIQKKAHGKNTCPQVQREIIVRDGQHQHNGKKGCAKLID